MKKLFYLSLILFLPLFYSCGSNGIVESDIIPPPDQPDATFPVETFFGEAQISIKFSGGAGAANDPTSELSRLKKLVFEAIQNDNIVKNAIIDEIAPSAESYGQELTELQVGIYTIKVSAFDAGDILLSEANQPDVVVSADSPAIVNVTLSFDNINTVPVTYPTGNVAVAVAVNPAPIVTIDPLKIEITGYTPPKGQVTYQFVRINFEQNSIDVKDGEFDMCSLETANITVKSDYLFANLPVKSEDLFSPNNENGTPCIFYVSFLKSFLNSIGFDKIRITVNAQDADGGTGSASVEFSKEYLLLN